MRAKPLSADERSSAEEDAIYNGPWDALDPNAGEPGLCQCGAPPRWIHRSMRIVRCNTCAPIDTLAAKT